MPFMFEVYYPSPVDEGREKRIAEIAERDGGTLDFREHDGTSIRLTFEFSAMEAADRAAQRMREHGEHVEGPCQYALPERRVTQGGLCPPTDF